MLYTSDKQENIFEQIKRIFLKSINKHLTESVTTFKEQNYGYHTQSTNLHQRCILEGEWGKPSP